jgi:hypothetical protein
MPTAKNVFKRDLRRKTTGVFIDWHQKHTPVLGTNQTHGQRPGGDRPTWVVLNLICMLWIQQRRHVAPPSFETCWQTLCRLGTTGPWPLTCGAIGAITFPGASPTEPSGEWRSRVTNVKGMSSEMLEVREKGKKSLLLTYVYNRNLTHLYVWRLMWNTDASYTF